MANRKKDNKLLFDPSIMAERLESLRKDDENRNVNSLTLGQLESNIKGKTGVSISAQQLSTYEKDTSIQSPNINNLLALAEYYNVSLDYLLGRSTSKSESATDKHTAEKFGLSDKSMKLLNTIKHHYPMYLWENESINIGNETVSSDLINFIFENKNFWSGFDNLLSNYIQAKNKNKRVQRSETSDVGAARYSLVMLFEKLVDEIYESLPKPKTKQFFEIKDKNDLSSL